MYSQYCCVLLRVSVIGVEVLSRYFSGVFLFKQKTAYDMRISDWSSDVCSSDLQVLRMVVEPRRRASEGADPARPHSMQKGPVALLGEQPEYPVEGLSDRG